MSYSVLAFRREVVNAVFLNIHLRIKKHIAIKDVPLDVRFDDVRLYHVPSEKQRRCKVCKKNLRHSYIKCKFNLHDGCLETFHGIRQLQIIDVY